jgi:hypothetical protein
MSYQFHIGQKVVCVVPKDEGTILVKDRIYTVRGFVPNHQRFADNDQLAIYLDEVSCGVGNVCEYGFYAYRFRPLIKTDISIFEAMLVPLNGKVEA